MAKFVLKDASVTINGTAISDHCRTVTLEDSAEEVDFTAFTTSNYREFGAGLKDATITLEVFNDFAASSIDSIFYPLYDSGGTFAIVTKASQAATSATNPSYTMTGRLFSYTPFSGAVGDAATTDVTIRNAGTAGIVRGTA